MLERVTATGGHGETSHGKNNSVMTYVSGSFEVHCISAEPMESGKEFALGTRNLSGRYKRQKAVWEETDEAECFFPQFDVSENRTQPRLKRQADLDWSVSNPHTRRRPRDDSGESELFCQLTAADTVRFQVSLGNELPGVGRVVRNPQVEPPVARELAPARLRSSRLRCLNQSRQPLGQRSYMKLGKRCLVAQERVAL